MIVVDKQAMASDAEENAVLAEEIGHYETHSLYVLEPGYNSRIARNNRIKYEARAKSWSYKNRMPFEELQEAVNKYCGLSELSEYFCLPIDFIHRAIEYYKTQGLFLKIPE